MKTLVLTLFISTLLLNCSKSDDSDVSNDFTKYDWKLVSINLANETISLSEKSYVKPWSYILRFSNNSIFYLDTSVNAASGKYSINDNILKLRAYQELSEASTNDPEQIKINNLLLQRLLDVIGFSTEQDNLILYSENDSFIFMKN